MNAQLVPHAYRTGDATFLTGIPPSRFRLDIPASDCGLSSNGGCSRIQLDDMCGEGRNGLMPRMGFHVRAVSSTFGDNHVPHELKKCITTIEK